jgi:hypothetical protein
LQATFADDPSDTRQGYISEEIARALEAVNPAKKKAYLAALGELFPAWQSPGGEATDAPALPANSGTPEALMEQVLALVPSLTPEERDHFAQRLQQAGLKTNAGAGYMDIPQEYQKKLGLAPDKPLQMERGVKLLAALMDVTMAMDQLSWALWKQIAPQSNIRKEGELSKLAGPYLAGDTEVSTQQLSQVLERTRKLMASLLGGIGRGSNTYARKYVGQFAPEVILDLSKLEQKMLQNLEQIAWKKYTQLAKEHASEPAIENEIQKAIAKAAEAIMSGGRMAV